MVLWKVQLGNGWFGVFSTKSEAIDWGNSFAEMTRAADDTPEYRLDIDEWSLHREEYMVYHGA